MKQSTRFLLVDDFSSMRKMIKNVLTDLGYSNIVEAENGVHAWELIQKAEELKSQFDVIVSDWNMPQMSGLELLKKCKSDSSARAIPFIMVTAESEQKQIVEAITNGCADYIVKPFSPQVIKEKIHRLSIKLSEKSAG